MPTYDYVCNACGHRFEEFQTMTAKELRKCPACGANKLERLIGTGAGVIFKGSGFYETDYRGESYSSDAKKDSSSGDKPDSESSSSKSDTKKASPKSTGAKNDSSGQSTKSKSKSND